MESRNCACVICKVNFPSELNLNEENRQNVGALFDDIWKLFCNLFNLQIENWNGIKQFYLKVNDIPFCQLCRNKLARLLILQKQFESIQEKMRTIETALIQSILETEAVNCDLNLMDFTKANCHDPDEEQVSTAIKSLRHKIYAQFNPTVCLTNCQPHPLTSIKAESAATTSNFTEIPTRQIILESEEEDPLALNCDWNLEDEDVQQDFMDIDIKHEPLQLDSFSIEFQNEPESESMSKFYSTATSKFPLSKGEVVQVDLSSSKLQSPPLIRNNQNENKFEYGGWTFEKTNEGFLCLCGAKEQLVTNMTTHIQVNHLSSRNPAQVTKRGTAVTSVYLGNGKYVYENIWKFELTPKGNFECFTCKRLCRTRHIMVQHIRRQHCPEMCRFYCTPCHKGFIRLGELLSHQKSHRNRSIIDTRLQNETSNVNMIDDQLQNLEEAEIWNALEQRDLESACPTDDELSEQFIYRDKWPYLMISRLSDETVIFRCLTCRQERKSRRLVCQHILHQHINKCAFVCEHCPKGFSTKYKRQLHTEAHHSVGPNYRCENEGCHEVFLARDQFLKHQKKLCLFRSLPQSSR